MRKNPYLAHYFGTALDSSVEEERGCARKNFSIFPNSAHMTQRVFCPSSQASRRSEQANAPCTPVCTPPSNGTPGCRISGVVTGNGFPSSPPDGVRELPPLSPACSLRPTPVEGHPGWLTLSHSDVPAARADPPTNSTPKSPKQARHSMMNGEAPAWDSMLVKSRAAIAQAKQLLDGEKPQTPLGIDTSSHPNLPLSQWVSLDAPNGFLDATSLKAESVSVESTPVVATQEQKQPEKEDVNVMPSPISSVPPSSVDHTHANVSTLQQQLTSTPISSVPPRQPAVEARHAEDDENVILSPTSSGVPRSSLERSLPDVPALRPAASASLETRCIVLTLNPNAATCAAKRLTRRPPYATAMLHRNHRAATREEEVRMLQQEQEQQTAPIVVSTVTPTSEPRTGRKRSKSTDRKPKESVISVDSLYGILERLAYVVHPRPLGDSVGSNSKKAGLDVSNDRHRSLHASIETQHEGGVQRRGRSVGQPVPAPQVLMGSAPRLDANETLLNSHRDSLNAATLSTSQLPEVGVSLHGAVHQRTSGSRRSSVNRAPRMPGYAMPTECWLYKGAEVGDAHVDTSRNLDGTRVKATSR